MAYKQYDEKKATKLCKEVKSIQEEYDKLGKLDIKKKKETKKRLETASKAAQSHLENDMKGVQASLKKHADIVQKNWVLLEKQLNQAKAALKEFKEDPNTAMNKKPYETATQSASYMETIYKVVKKDAVEFGKSWACYRSYNAKINGLADKKYHNGFNTMVGKVMNEQKSVTNQIKKMEMLVKQAAQVKSLAEAAGKVGASSYDKNMKLAKKVVKDTEEILKKMQTEKGMNFKSIQQNDKTISAQLKIMQGDAKQRTKKMHQLCVSMRTNAIAIQKAFVNWHRTAEKLVKTTKDNMGPYAIHPPLVKLMTQAERNVKASEEFKKKATALTKQIVPNVGKVEKLCKGAK